LDFRHLCRIATTPVNFPRDEIGLKCRNIGHHARKFIYLSVFWISINQRPQSTIGASVKFIFKGPTAPTLVEKFSKVLPTATYCDFGPPSLRFRLRIAPAFATLQRGKSARGIGATSGKRVTDGPLEALEIRIETPIS
jgi:hypothetical protein